MSELTPAEVVARIPGRRVLVVGDVMLDEYLFGDVRRISPEAPVPVVELRRRADGPGGAASAAANCAGLRCRALLAGVVGDDEAGRRLREALLARGVATEGLLVDGRRPTTAKTRVIAHGQQVVRVDQEDRSALPESLEGRLLAFVRERLAWADACVLSDYAKGVVSASLARGLIGACAAAGKPLVADPKGRDASKYRGASVLKPNLNEAALLLRREVDSPQAALEAGARLAGELGGAVLLTRGADGMTLFRPHREHAHFPAQAREVFDVTGAGDTVAATLAAALAAGADLEMAARLAGRAAGAVVGRLGASAATPEDLAGPWAGE
jgi:D-beta-D-heptose 7-phosphate kinase/D-beta-D-heptose 1-phosphate adenosyltransferase